MVDSLFKVTLTKKKREKEEKGREGKREEEKERKGEVVRGASSASVHKQQTHVHRRDVLKGTKRQCRLGIGRPVLETLLPTYQNKARNGIIIMSHFHRHEHAYAVS